MKITAFLPRLLKRTGFTLVELLVVMGIIAILAAVSLQVGITVLSEAKKTKAANTANQIQTAVLNYYTEYSVYPTPSGTSTATDFKLDDADSTTQWAAMIECLAGGISPSSGGTVTLTTFTNTRSIAFLSLKASDVGSGSPYTKDAPINPLPYSTAHPYFNMAIDGDYDGILGTGASAVTTMPNFSGTGTFSFTSGGGSSTAGCAVWADCSPSGSTSQAGWCVHTY